MVTTIRVYTLGRSAGVVAVVRRDGREVWRSRAVPYGMGGLAKRLAEQWMRGL